VKPNECLILSQYVTWKYNKLLSSIFALIFIYTNVYIYVYVCVCVCVQI
jgi:hypothetical protein